MIRKSFVGLAGAIVVAAIVAQASTSAQGSAAPTSSTQQAQPAQKSGGVVPATTPTQQPTTGAAEEPKVVAATLMSVRIPKRVMADGKPLPAGTYMLRVTNDSPSPVVGQTASEQRWVEFLQGGQVKGREVATVLSTSEARAIAKQGLPPAGAATVQTLVGNDYLRVWINKGGTNYLVHLPNS